MTKGSDEINESWPYVTEKQETESEEHIRMKNLAINWLLNFGFETGDIEVEHTVYSSNSHGYTDVYAERGGNEVFVECERGPALRGNLSKGGSIPAKQGKEVYFLNDEWIYRVKYEDVELERKYTSSIFEDDSPETSTRKLIQFEQLGPVPSKSDGDRLFCPEDLQQQERVSWL